jgi:hypothetical protein
MKCPKDWNALISASLALCFILSHGIASHSVGDFCHCTFHTTTVVSFLVYVNIKERAPMSALVQKQSSAMVGQ